MAENTADAIDPSLSSAQDEPPEFAEEEADEDVVSSQREGAGSTSHLAQNGRHIPVWEQRLSGRAKLRRALVIVAAVAVALAVLIASTSFPQATWQRVQAALRSPQPTATPLPWTLPPLLPSRSIGKLAMTSWQSIPVPDAGRSQVSFTPFPNDPTAIFACTAARNIPGQGPLAGPVKLWRTHDTGQHWQLLTLPSLTADTCIVRIGPQNSTSQSILLLTYTSGAPSLCQSPAFFVSTNDGASWKPLNPPHHRGVNATEADAPLRCDAWATTFYLYWYEADICQLLQPASCDELLRSSDGGKTWQHADKGIANGLFSPVWIAEGKGEVQKVAYVPLQATTTTTQTPTTALWTTSDAGDSWEPMSDFPHTAPTLTVVYQGSGAPVSSAWSAIYRELFDPSGNNLQNIVQSIDFKHWSTLPPLPMPGTDVRHDGIAEVVGEDNAGNLLVFGPAPRTGVPLIGPNHLPGTPGVDRLWSWSPQTWQWSVGALTVPVLPEDTALDWGFGPDSSTNGSYGTWVWLVSPSARGTSLTRTFLPG